MVWSDMGLGSDAVARLTLEAIRYAIHLNRLRLPVPAMSQAVYDFNRLPLGGLHHGLACGSVALADELQRVLAAEGCDLDAQYQRRVDDQTKWIYWSLPGVDRPGGRLRHKLYVSPAMRALRPALVAVLRLCRARRVAGFKLGLDGHGILRSDKLVVYFPEAGPRAVFARELLARTDGLEAQGVPLTKGVGASGLLSTAEDPLMGDLSWRQLISAELVDILLAAGEPARSEPVESVSRIVCAELGRRGLRQALVAEGATP